MPRILIVCSLLVMLLFACKPNIAPINEVVIAEPIVESIVLPDVEFLEATTTIDSTITAFLEIDYENDSIQYVFNGEEMAFNELPLAHEAWKKPFSEKKRPYLTLNIRADEVTPIADMHDLKLLLRQMSQLKLSYENRVHEQLLAKLPPFSSKAPFKSPRTPKIKVNNSSMPPPPPPPPVIEKLEFTSPNRACVFKNGQFFYKGKTYESCKECAVSALRPYFEVTLQDNKVLLNGKLLAVDSLQTVMMDIFDALEKEAKPKDPKIFNKLLILHAYDMNSDYGSYMSVNAQLRNCFALLRDQQAMKLFNKPFTSLTKQEKRTVRSLIPMVIAEDIL